MTVSGEWDAAELGRIGAATELQIAPERRDGTLPRAIPIWHAVIGDALYVRSARGPENGWFRRARATGRGQVSAGGVTKDVTFVLADPSIRAALDAALHAKYDRFGAAYVDPITGDDVLETTLKVMPRA